MSLSHGAKTWFLKNLEKFFCCFPPGAFPMASLEDILRMLQLSITQVMLPSSWTSPLQHKMLPHFRDSEVQRHPLRASSFRELGRGCGMVMGAWHLGGLQALMSCSSPESPSPSHAWSCPMACPWCHADHWKKAKNLCYGTLKANHFLHSEWIVLESFRVFLRILLDFINLKFIRILLA